MEDSDMNCMKHRRQREKSCDKVVRELLGQKIQQVMRESMIIGVDGALENLRKETEALKEANNNGTNEQ